MGVWWGGPHKMEEKGGAELEKCLWGAKKNNIKILKLVEHSSEILEKALILGEKYSELSRDTKELVIQQQNYIKAELKRLSTVRIVLEEEGHPWPSSEKTRIDLKKTRAKSETLDHPRTKILIIEDEAIIVKSIVYFLIQENYEVIYALDAEEGIEKVFKEKPDLILLDIMMPGMDGYQFLNAIKQKKESAMIPIIILSSLSRESDILEGLERGAVDYLTKPFSPPVLMSKIKKVLASQDDFLADDHIP